MKLVVGPIKSLCCCCMLFCICGCIWFNIWKTWGLGVELKSCAVLQGLRRLNGCKNRGARENGMLENAVLWCKRKDTYKTSKSYTCWLVEGDSDAFQECFHQEPRSRQSKVCSSTFVTSTSFCKWMKNNPRFGLVTLLSSNLPTIER